MIFHVTDPNGKDHEVFTRFEAERIGFPVTASAEIGRGEQPCSECRRSHCCHLLKRHKGPNQHLGKALAERCKVRMLMDCPSNWPPIYDRLIESGDVAEYWFRETPEFPAWGFEGPTDRVQALLEDETLWKVTKHD